MGILCRIMSGQYPIVQCGVVLSVAGLADVATATHHNFTTVPPPPLGGGNTAVAPPAWPPHQDYAQAPLSVIRVAATAADAAVSYRLSTGTTPPTHNTWTHHSWCPQAHSAPALATTTTPTTSVTKFCGFHNHSINTL